MANFTQLHLGNKTPQEPARKDTNKNSLSRKKTLFGAGLLAITVMSGVFLLITNGCSKGPAKNTPVSSENQTSQISTPATPAPVMASVPPTPAPKPVHKRVQRKAPTATYSDPVNGISFRYPKSYDLKTGEQASGDEANKELAQMNFAQPGGVNVAAIELPRSSYPGTDFTSASFNVNVNSQMTAEQCGLFGSTVGVVSDKQPSVSSKAKIGAEEFNVIENLGPESKEPNTKYYHVFENGNCYEFGMGVATVDGSTDGLKPVNRAQVFRKLEQILATVKLEPVAVPEVAKGTQDHPVVEGGKE